MRLGPYYLLPHPLMYIPTCGKMLDMGPDESGGQHLCLQVLLLGYCLTVSTGRPPGGGGFVIEITTKGAPAGTGQSRLPKWWDEWGMWRGRPFATDQKNFSSLRIDADERGSDKSRSWVSKCSDRKFADEILQSLLP